MLLKIKVSGGWGKAGRMGQALRRVTGRVRSSDLGPATSTKFQNVEKKRTPAVPPVDPKATLKKNGEGGTGAHDVESSDSFTRINPDNVLEERDPEYDAMLSQMVGRIRSKPGGKLEMGEAFIVEKYNRPMPKLRSTKAEPSRDEEPVSAGTVNVSQLKQIFLLQQGKAEDHEGPMDVERLAEKFRIDVMQVKRILQFLSLPPKDSNSEKKD